MRRLPSAATILQALESARVNPAPSAISRSRTRPASASHLECLDISCHNPLQPCELRSEMFNQLFGLTLGPVWLEFAPIKSHEDGLPEPRSPPTGRRSAQGVRFETVPGAISPRSGVAAEIAAGPEWFRKIRRASVIAVEGNEEAGLVVADVEMGDLAGRGVLAYGASSAESVGECQLQSAGNALFSATNGLNMHDSMR